jgi:hypothetical protein
MNIIAKLSFWILKPSKMQKSTFSKLLFWKNHQFEELIMDALDQFKREGYVEKLKTCITSVSFPSDHQDLSGFLYDLIAQI